MDIIETMTLEQLIEKRNELNDIVQVYALGLIVTPPSHVEASVFALQLADLQLINSMIVGRMVERFDVGYELLNL